MTWETHIPHKATGETGPFYTYTVIDKDGEQHYAAFIVPNADGFKAVVPKHLVPPKDKLDKHHYYTHDTLQEAKDWCVVELVKRRLET